MLKSIIYNTRSDQLWKSPAILVKQGAEGQKISAIVLVVGSKQSLWNKLKGWGFLSMETVWKNWLEVDQSMG